MEKCSAAIAELRHNGWEDDREHKALAKEQMSLVKETAIKLLAGHTITAPDGSAWSVSDVTDCFSETVTPEIMIKIMTGDLFEAQKVIGDCAQQVAFWALDLESAPFLDLNDLITEAEQ